MKKNCLVELLGEPCTVGAISFSQLQ